MRTLLLLRPEPGLSASVARARGMGLDVIARPLFRIDPVAWDVPANDYDALLLTSANAIRHGGSSLATLKHLPVHAVGKATAEAARDAGLAVASTGEGDAATLAASLPKGLRLLHLAGEQRHAIAGADIVTVYRAAVVDDPDLPSLHGLVAAVHSPRAGQRLAELANARSATAIAAISRAAADSCGPGWECVAVAERPDDDRLLAVAAALCHTSPPA